MRIPAIITCAAALALAACGSETSGEFTTEDGESGEYTVDPETGETTMTIDTPDGETSLRAGSDVTPDLPDGWSLYPGAKVVNAINVAGADGGGSMVTMTTDASVEDVIEHYRAQAEATGFPIEMELTMEASRIIGGQKSDGSTFSVSVVPDAEGGPSTVQLTLAEG